MCVWVSGQILADRGFPFETPLAAVETHSTGTDRHFDQVCFIRVDRKLKSTDVIDVLSDLFILRGVPEHVRSDNGPEFVAKAVQDWIAAVGAKTAYIEPGSPWKNGHRKLQCSPAR